MVKHDGILCLELNGGWNYPSLNYIWNRVYAELNTKEDLEGTLSFLALLPSILYSIDCLQEVKVSEQLCSIVLACLRWITPLSW